MAAQKIAESPDTPLTIVHTEASDGWGGQDIRVLREAEWFRARGHTVHLVTPRHAELFKRATAAGFSPVPMGLNKRTRFGDFFRLRALFKKLKPDMVGTHSSIDSWVGLLAAKSAGIPCRLRYRHVSTPVKPNAANRWMYQTLATHIITTSQAVSSQLVETLSLNAGHTTCVATGIQAPAVLPDRETARRTLAAELGLSESARFAGQVSVLRTWKGHSDLIAAFDQLAARHPELHLVLVGEGPYRWKVEQDRSAAAFRERIHLIGHRENPWPLFRAMDVCCLCSTGGEGIPQALIQAMLAGTPGIGTEVGGIPELIHHGETGLLVPPSDPVKLAEAICDLLDHPDRAALFAKTAECRARAERSPDIMGNAVLAIIRETLAAHKNRKTVGPVT